MSLLCWRNRLAVWERKDLWNLKDVRENRSLWRSIWPRFPKTQGQCSVRSNESNALWDPTKVLLLWKVITLVCTMLITETVLDTPMLFWTRREWSILKSSRHCSTTRRSENNSSRVVAVGKIDQITHASRHFSHNISSTDFCAPATSLYNHSSSHHGASSRTPIPGLCAHA